MRSSEEDNIKLKAELARVTAERDSSRRVVDESLPELYREKCELQERLAEMTAERDSAERRTKQAAEALQKIAISTEIWTREQMIECAFEALAAGRLAG